MRDRSSLIQELIQSEKNYFEYLLCMKEVKKKKNQISKI